MIEHLKWRKSSYSTGDGGGNECAEVAWHSDKVLVRDSKNPGLHLRANLTGLLNTIKAVRLDA
jgi:hypothetical protein